jgi:hypothetical protein
MLDSRAVFTFDVRWKGYANRTDALEAAGLRE